MIKAKSSERDAILEYLLPNVEKCLYLYLDIFQYGIGDTQDTVDVWYEMQEDEYSVIIMKYYNSLQMYSVSNNFSVSDLRELADNYGIERIFSEKTTIDYISDMFPDYLAQYGKVSELKKHRDFSKYYHRIEKASVDDISELVALLLMDEENARSYNSNKELEAMLKHLFETDLGESYILREDGKIVATGTILAKSDVFLIAAYSMVHPDYHHTLYGSIVDSYLTNVVKKERRLFGFMMDPRRIRALELTGNPVVSEYGKLIKK